jgi:Predicted Zn-dependent hydrolases of the beta-lactamase fold
VKRGNEVKKTSAIHKEIMIVTLILFLLLSLSACSKKEPTADVNAENQHTVKQPTVTQPMVTQAAPVSKDKDVPAVTSPAINSKKANNISSKPKPNAISIKYIGNSCFYITFQDGTRLVTDPYGESYEESFGKLPKMEADVICITHNHDDHISGINRILGKPKIIQADETGKTIKVGKVKITGYTTEHVANMCPNTIYVYQSGDFKIVDMGETDNIASKEAVNAVKGADVILAYAGEYGAIKNAESFKTLKKLNIKVMIPQHYSNNPNELFFDQPTIDKILKEVPDGMKVTKTEEFILNKDIKQEFVYLKNWAGF